MTSVMTIFCTVLTPGQYLFDLEFWPRLIFNAATAFAFMFTTWLGLGSFIWACLRRNIPWFWAEIIFYVPLALMTTLMIKLFLHPAATAFTLLWIFVIIIVNILLILVLTKLVLRDHIIAVFSRDSVKIPYWQPTQMVGCQLQPLLPAKKQGKVLRMTAANQYVQVFTEKGEALVRLSLNEATRLVPETSGLRVHRSHWIAKKNICDFWFENGNPRLKDRDGAIIPVSRSMADEVRTAQLQLS